MHVVFRLLWSMLIAASLGWSQPSRSTAVATTSHFAFYSDPGANLNDALVAAGAARRAKNPAHF